MTDIVGALTESTSAGTLGLLARLGFNLFFTTIVVRFVYYRLYRSRDYVFTYFLINLVTFSIAYLLSNVPMQMGLALGLFAVFGILRYRTEAIAVRNLTYLFVVIGIALLNALANGGMGLAEVLIGNAVIAGTVVILEATPFSSREESRVIRYDRLDLLGPADAAALIEDVRARTHLPVERFEVGDVDLLRDSATITVHFRSNTAQRSRQRVSDRESVQRDVPVGERTS